MHAQTASFSPHTLSCLSSTMDELKSDVDCLVCWCAEISPIPTWLIIVWLHSEYTPINVILCFCESEYRAWVTTVLTGLVRLNVVGDSVYEFLPVCGIKVYFIDSLPWKVEIMIRGDIHDWMTILANKTSVYFPEDQSPNEASDICRLQEVVRSPAVTISLFLHVWKPLFQ